MPGSDSLWHLAQINIATLVAARGDPRVEPFFEALDSVNALAEASPGFVWRLKEEEGGNATDIAVSPDPLLIVNMSVWQDAQTLFDFVYRSAHTGIMSRRREFFGRAQGAYQALWWIPAGTVPTIEDGLARLWLLDRFGPSARAFTFKARYPNPDETAAPVDMQPDPWCIANA